MRPTLECKQRDEDAVSKMIERKEMLILAQQKLDEINRCELGLSLMSKRPSSSRNNQRKSATSIHLLSTLLYIALMTYKVEEMKAMLQEEDSDIYGDWQILFDSLHSPEFHARERLVQNKRVNGTFERKRRYKVESIRLQNELNNTCTRLSELQKIANESSHRMSKTINDLQGERAVLVSKGEEKQTRLDELNEEIKELKVQIERNDATIFHKNETIGRLNRELEFKEESILATSKTVKSLEERSSQMIQELAVTNQKAWDQEETLKQVKLNLESSDEKFLSYRLEKESVIDELQHKLREAEAHQAVQNEQLLSRTESLSEAKKELTDNRVLIEHKIDSLQKSSMEQSILIQDQLTNSSIHLLDLQKLSNQTNQHMSKEINVLQEERRLLLSKETENHRMIDGLNEKIHELNVQVEKSRAALFNGDKIVDHLREELGVKERHIQEKYEVIRDLEEKLSQAMQELAVTKQNASNHLEALKETQLSLGKNDNIFLNYRLEKESLVDKLHQDLRDAATRHAVLNAQLQLANESLRAGRKDLDDNKTLIESKIDSFCSTTKMETAHLRDQLADTCARLSELQKLSNETSEHMSSLEEGKQIQVNELNVIVKQLQVQIEKHQETIMMKNEIIEHLRNEMQSKTLVHTELESQLSQMKHELAVANEKASSHLEALKEAKMNLEKSDTRFENYRLEKESFIAELQQDLKDVETHHAVVNAQFLLANESLKVGRKDLDDNKSLIEFKIDSLCAASKVENSLLQDQLADACTRLTELQRLSNETSKHIVEKEEKEIQINELRAIVHELQVQIEKHQGAILMKNETINNLRHEMQSGVDSNKNLEETLSRIIQELAIANQKTDNQQNEIKEANSRLERCDMKFESYRLEKESIIEKLQLDLKDAGTHNALERAHLLSVTESLADAKNALNNVIVSVEAKIDSFSVASKMESAHLQHQMADTCTQLSEMQKVSNERSQHILMEEKDKQNQINQLRAIIHELQVQIENHQTAFLIKNETMEKICNEIKRGVDSNKNLKEKWQRMMQELTVANQTTVDQQNTITEANLRLERCNTKFESCRVDYENFVEELKLHLKDKETRNAVESAQLLKAIESLIAANNALTNLTASMESKINSLCFNSQLSLSEIRRDSCNIMDVVVDFKSDIPRISGKLTQAETLINEMHALQKDTVSHVSNWTKIIPSLEKVAEDFEALKEIMNRQGNYSYQYANKIEEGKQPTIDYNKAVLPMKQIASSSKQVCSTASLANELVHIFFSNAIKSLRLETPL